MGLKFKFFPLGLAGEEAVFVMPLDGILFIGLTEHDGRDGFILNSVRARLDFDTGATIGNVPVPSFS